MFTFVLDHPRKLLQELKSVESNDVQYGGHTWSLVCMRKDEAHLGLFLKLRYTDGNSAASVSTKTKFSMTLIHRSNYRDNVNFVTTQKFTSAQPMLGKSRFISMEDLFDQSGGYLDDTGKQIVLELGFSRSTTRFEKTVDISPVNRTRKNASGVYFDTSTFLFASHRWYLRFYTKKLNANGLPAVYLYLSGKSKGISLELQFTLFLGVDCTEILSYNFGEGAKFDGFGRTLPEPLTNPDRMTEVTVAVEVNSMIIYKCAAVRLRPPVLHPPGTMGFTSRVYKDNYGAYNGLSGSSASSNSLVGNEAFQDQEGNFWKIELVRDSKMLTILFDKGVHHFQNNKTKVVCLSAVLLSRDPQQIKDVHMNGYPIVGYFSNFTDDKGYLMTFPIQLFEVGLQHIIILIEVSYDINIVYKYYKL